MKYPKSSFILVIIVFLAVALRVWHLIVWFRTPYFTGLFLDELYHHLWAKRICSGALIPGGVFFRAPLYPYLLATIYFIFGDGGIAPRMLQALCGVLSIFPVFLTAREVLSNRRFALVAAALWALCPMQIFFESRLLLDSCFAAGVAWFPYILLLARRKRLPSLCALAGIWLGILTILRPTALILAIPMVIFLWRYVRWRSLIAIVAIVLPIAPVTISNIANGDFVLIASQGGINFYIGNNAESDGASAIVPELGRNWRYRQCVEIASAETGVKLTPSQVSQFFFIKGFKFWRDSPKQAILLWLRKLVMLFTSPQIGNNGNIYFLLRSSPLRFLHWFWAMLFSLATVGVTFSKFRHRGFFTMTAIIYSLLIVSFFVCERFRLPVVALIVIPAAAGVEVLVTQRRVAPFVAAICIFVFSLFDPYGWRRTPAGETALSHFSLGNIFLRQGKLDDAISEYRRALKLNPAMRGAHLNWGAIYFKLGELDSAKAQFKAEIGVNGDVCRASSNIGVLERVRGNYAMAIHWGERSIKKCISEPSAVFNYAMTLHSAGYFWRADSLLRTVISEYSDNPRILNLAGAVAMALGDTIRAESLWTAVLNVQQRPFVEMYDLGAIYSEQAGVGASLGRVRSWAYYNLAQIAMARRNIDKAEQLIKIAVAQDTTFAQGYAALGTIMLAKGKLDIAYTNLMKAEHLGYVSPELFFNIAAIATRRGDMHDAEIYLRKTLDIAPDFVPAIKALKALKSYVE